VTRVGDTVPANRELVTEASALEALDRGSYLWAACGLRAGRVPPLMISTGVGLSSGRWGTDTAA
jgi:hypothetical protein